MTEELHTAMGGNLALSSRLPLRSSDSRYIARILDHSGTIGQLGTSVYAARIRSARHDVERDYLVGERKEQVYRFERTIAPPGSTRWLILPAALRVHLCHCARSRRAAVSLKACTYAAAVGSVRLLIGSTF